MREFLDAILTVIDSESLTDDEFESMELPEAQTYSPEIYQALKLVLESREGVSGQVKRLKLYFVARGTDFSSLSSGTNTPNSKIYIGDAL